MSDDTATAPALTEEASEILARLQEELGDAIVEHARAIGDVVVRVKPDAWRRTAEICKERIDCDYLSFVSGIDWMPAPLLADEGSGDTSAPVQPKEQTFGVAGSAGRYQVFAVVESTRRRRWRAIVKTDVGDDLRVESWVPVYPGADWHEREAWEMFGFVFDGHPSLRHLYLPSEFEGHPLRKDFPLLAREVKPWPGLVDVEPMPGGGEDMPGGGASDDEESAGTAE
ncbi:MAG TPA: NADH-quinone oxidoreductase subunit C [Acidimicrobiia bacterium]|nr:NADH-quinone oxidoreductase subunit C [Acidimicrobiia bacterium]